MVRTLLHRLPMLKPQHILAAALLTAAAILPGTAPVAAATLSETEQQAAQEANDVEFWTVALLEFDDEPEGQPNEALDDGLEAESAPLAGAGLLGDE